MPYFGIRVVVVNDLTKPGGDEVDALGRAVREDDFVRVLRAEELACLFAHAIIRLGPLWFNLLS